MNRTAALVVLVFSLACGGMGGGLNDDIDNTTWTIKWPLSGKRESITFVSDGSVVHSWSQAGSTWTVDGDTIKVDNLQEEASFEFTRRDKCTMSVLGLKPNAKSESYRKQIGEVVWDHPDCR